MNLLKRVEKLENRLSQHKKNLKILFKFEWQTEMEVIKEAGLIDYTGQIRIIEIGFVKS